MRPDAEAAFAAALTQHESGHVEAARAAYQAILAENPEHAESLHLLGLITVQAGDPDTGAHLIQRAIALSPGRAPHHNSLALAYRAVGRAADAVREYITAVELRPGSAEIHNNLASLLRDLGEWDAAVAEYRLAAACAPGIAEIWNNLANVLALRRTDGEVEGCFRRAIDARPGFVAALADYGGWLTGRCRWNEAVAWLARAADLAPGNAAILNNLGVARQEAGDRPRAEADFRRAITLDPNLADAHYNLGCLLFSDGNADAALASHAAALAADNLHGGARLAQCMSRLPMLYQNEAEIERRRTHYLSGLDELVQAVARPEIAASVAAAIGTSQPFFLPYQGKNDLAAQAIYGALVHGLLAGEPSPAKPRSPMRGERIRVGILSGFFQDHTIFKLFLEGWLTQLDRDRFELISFHTGHVHDDRTERSATLSDRFISGLASQAAWRDAVAEAAPHVLLYPEIGIDPLCGRLAAQRLAPVQCVAWGHPETTGLPTIDHFLSADLMEPPDAETHYAEHLVRLPGLGLHYTPDEQKIVALDRSELGLEPDIPVYWSGQALYKYLPRFDSVFPRIAEAVGRCQFVFIGFAKSQAVTAAFRARLAAAFAAFGLDSEQYCVMLPPMPQHRYLAAVAASDVILDTIGWSGGKSTLDCLSVDPAIVTLPGRYLRGRHTEAILQCIGGEATIAKSLDQYVAIAARLGSDPAWRARIRQTVAAGKHKAFRDTNHLRVLETFLTRMVKQAG